MWSGTLTESSVVVLLRAPAALRTECKAISLPPIVRGSNGVLAHLLKEPSRVRNEISRVLILM
jgi:hypothetical protein